MGSYFDNWIMVRVPRSVHARLADLRSVALMHDASWLKQSAGPSGAIPLWAVIDRLLQQHTRHAERRVASRKRVAKNRKGAQHAS